jgi:hypothetical protein
MMRRNENKIAASYTNSLYRAPLAKGFGDDRERRTREGVNPLASPTGSLSRIIAQDEWVR